MVIKQYLVPGQPMPDLSQRSAVVLNYVVERYVNRESPTQEMVSRMESTLSQELPACEQLLLLDALITLTLPQRDRERLAHLDCWSARAYELGAEIPTVKGSRGAVLIEIGRP